MATMLLFLKEALCDAPSTFSKRALLFGTESLLWMCSRSRPPTFSRTTKVFLHCARDPVTLASRNIASRASRVISGFSLLIVSLSRVLLRWSAKVVLETARNAICSRRLESSQSVKRVEKARSLRAANSLGTRCVPLLPLFCAPFAKNERFNGILLSCAAVPVHWRKLSNVSIAAFVLENPRRHPTRVTLVLPLDLSHAPVAITRASKAKRVQYVKRVTRTQ